MPLGPERTRAAVSALFFSNGLMIGSWAPKLPTLMQRLSISEGTAGLVVLCLGLGSLVVMPVFGAMTARHGSARAVRVATVLAVPILLLMSVAPDLWTVAGSVFLFGGFLGGMDVAMNANAVVVERRRKLAIMSSCHGFWSLGGVAGAGLGGILLSRFGEIGHAAVVTLTFAITAGIALRYMAQDRPSPHEEKPPLRLPRSGMPYLLGLIALCCMIPEGAILDWAAVYLQREMEASLALAGWGFAACAATMAVMRFAGDVIRQRLGAVRTFRISAVVAMIGLTLSSMAPTAGLAIAGFGMAGLGIANLVPIAFSAAGNIPGLAQGMGLSVVTMMGYCGILLAPGTIGQLAEYVSFGAIYLGLAGLLVLPLLLSSLARSAEFGAGGEEGLAPAA